MAIKVRKQAAASVTTPPSTHLQFFVDTDGTPKLKDSLGNTYTVAQTGNVSLDETTTPAPIANKVLVYAKDVLGVSQPFALSDDGTEIQLGGGGGGGFNVVFLNDADPHVLAPGNEYQITATGQLTFDLAAVEGDSVRVRIMAQGAWPIGDYSVTYQIPANPNGWFSFGNSDLGGYPVSTFFEWEYRTVGQPFPQWFLVETNYAVDPLVLSSNSVVTSGASPNTTFLGGPTLESLTGGALYAAQQKWMHRNSFASPFSGFNQMFTLVQANRAINTIEVLLVAGTDQTNDFYTHKLTVSHVCDAGSNFISGLNGTGEVASATPGSPFTVTTELSGSDVYLRVVNAGPGNKEWWAVATLSVAAFGVAPP